MPDTTPTELVSSARKSPRAAAADPAAPTPTEPDKTPRRVHFVLQGKGGVGKTWVASLLIQYHQENGRPVVSCDTDPVNSSLSAIPGLGAKSVKLFDGDQVAVAAIDSLMAEIMAASQDVVVDNGAASFVPLSQYLVENDIAGLLAGHGIQMIVHVVIAGGGMIGDTLSGLLSVIENYPPSVQVVAWINEYFGPVVGEGRELEQLPIYRDNQDRFAGIIRLARLNPASFGANLREMMDRKLTFAEALTNPDFTIIPMQRLAMIRREIWQQLARVI